VERDKTVLTNKSILAYFDPRKQTRISSDASKEVLGAVLMQLHDSKWLPVAYATCFVTDAECRKAQIEKECLGIVFACEIFHEYIYGAADTDHKPLLRIIKKSLSEMTLMLRIRRYDALSRGKSPKTKSDTKQELSIHVNLVEKPMPVSDDMWRTIAQETDKDETLHHVKTNIINGSIAHCNHYNNFLQELSIVDGVIIK